jgi:flavin-binding protein dodecin
MATAIKIVELMGFSESSFDDAVGQAVKETAKTVRNITGVEVIKSTAEVEGDEIFEYHVTVRLAFAIERGKSAADEGDGAEEESRGEVDEDDEDGGGTDDDQEK